MRRGGGFTFVELLVVVAIIAVTTGGGLVAFSRLQDRRGALQDAKLVEQQLRVAQRKALAGDKPSGCIGFPLSGYRVLLAPSRVTLEAVCVGGSPVQTVTNLSGDILSSSESEVVFGVLKGGATGASLDFCSRGTLYRILVSSEGNVEAPVEVEGGC